MEDELKNLDNDHEEADEDKDDDYEDINSRERHDEDANVHEVRPDFLERDTKSPTPSATRFTKTAVTIQPRVVDA